MSTALDALPDTFTTATARGAVCTRAIVCRVSAAAVHGLTHERPRAVQIAVAARSHPPRIEHPTTSVFRFEGATFEIGVS